MKGVVEGNTIDGKYVLIEKLSEGAGGIVWKARQPDGGDAALKILKWSPLINKVTATERFKREFELFKKLAHPNIAKIYDFGFDADQDLYYFTSELLTGGDLKKMIGAPVPVIEYLLLCALRALEYLRHYGILHLDIKPQNFLLRTRVPVLPSGGFDEGNLALIDFGISAFQPPNRPGGTPNYMAPEVVLRRTATPAKSLANSIGELTVPVVDHRSDLYSLGVTFYYILSGVLPFAVTEKGGSLNVDETVLRHLRPERPVPPSEHNPNVPAYLDAVIMRLIARHPDDRYQAAILAAQALCFRSPSRLVPESRETISAYLPEEGVLIGRRREKQMLEQTISGVVKGAADVRRVVCIAGAWGTGKTRLLKFLKPVAQQQEMVVVTDLRYQKPDFKRPTAFLIDDPFVSLPSIEVSSFSDVFVLRHLVHYLLEMPKSPFVLVFTVNTDLCKPVDMFRILEIDPASCNLIHLENFTVDEVNEYVTDLLGEAPSRQMVEELYRASFGNPKFITDIFKLMLRKGEFFSSFTGRPTSETLSSISFSFSHAASPPSLAAHFLELLDNLPRGARLMALRMACWHRATTIDELEKVGDGEATDADFSALLSSGLIRRAHDDGRFVFSNPLASKIIEAGLDPKERSAIHDSISGFIAARAEKSESAPSPFKGDGEGGGDLTFELTRHLAFSSNPDLQKKAARLFAIEALKRLHPAETAEQLESILNVVAPDDWETRSEILVRMGQALARIGRWDDAKAAFERLRSLARLYPSSGSREESGDESRSPRFELNLRADEQLGLLALRQRRLTEAREIFASALKAIRQSPITNHKSQIHTLRLENYLASVDLREGRYEEAAKTYVRTAKAVNLLPGEYRSQVTNNELGETLILFGRIEEAIKILSPELEWARKSDHRERMVGRLRLMGDAHRRLGDFPAARRYYEEALGLSREYYLFEHQLRILNGFANLFLQTGSWSEAIDHYKPALNLALQLEGKPTAVDVMANIGFAYGKLGQFDNSIEYLELALDFAKGPEAESSAQVCRTIPAIHITLGNAHYERKEYDEALKHLNIALEYDRKNPPISKTPSPLEREGEPLSTLMRYNLYGTLVEIDIAQGRPEGAVKHMPLLEELAVKIPEARAHFKQLADQIKKTDH